MLSFVLDFELECWHVEEVNIESGFYTNYWCLRDAVSQFLNFVDMLLKSIPLVGSIGGIMFD